MQGAPTALALQAEALVWSLDRQPERPRSRNPSCKGRAGADSGAAEWGGGAAPVPLAAEKNAGVLDSMLAVVPMCVARKRCLGPSGIRETSKEESWRIG